MNRRAVLSLIGGASLLPIAARAQQKPMPVIGYLSPLSKEAETTIGFLAGLAGEGFVVGRNLAIEYRFADGHPDRLSPLATELARLPVAVLVASGAGAAVAAKEATSTIPIVFGSGPDPVQLGLVANLASPGGNATGVTLFSTEVGPKRLELLREILPQPGTIAFVVDPRMPGTAPQIREVEAAAQRLGQPVLVLQGGSDDEVEKALATMSERQARGLIFGPSTYFQMIADKLIALAARHRIPAMYEWPEFVAAGGLMSYSADRNETSRLVGDYVGRILKGATPADLPVVRSTQFRLVINLKTASTLGLAVPQSLLERADEVIE